MINSDLDAKKIIMERKNDVLKIKNFLESNLKKDYRIYQIVHTIFLLHGKYICKSKPMCSKCKLYTKCNWYLKN